MSLSHTAEAALKPYLFLFFSPLTLSQSPPKGVTIPYRPKPSSSPVIFAGGQVRNFYWWARLIKLLLNCQLCQQYTRPFACLLKICTLVIVWPAFRIFVLFWEFFFCTGESYECQPLIFSRQWKFCRHSWRGNLRWIGLEELNCLCVITFPALPHPCFFYMGFLQR